jgi:hypothetical protein
MKFLNFIEKKLRLKLETNNGIFDPVILKLLNFSEKITKSSENNIQSAFNNFKSSLNNFQEAATKINESSSEKGFFANFKDGFDKSQVSNEPSKSSKPNTSPNPYMSGETSSCIAQIKRVEMDIKNYKEKYEEGMRSSDTTIREYAHNSYYDLIINRTKELEHLRTRLEQSLHSDSFKK